MVELRAIRGGLAGAESSGQLVSSSDPGLLAELYEKHAPAVFARCRYLLRDEEAAADALQDVFVRILRALPELRAAQSPTGWILRVTTNHCLNELRGRRAGWRTELVRMAQARPIEAANVDRRELVRALLSA
ncbi:MAG TPA: sigma-70 family RNA polymerase sigma factor, partial [Myxococcales bacterium]|nr:sigma-70 family RNA polymerase sigma factor [Myxococcales bacterium]